MTREQSEEDTRNGTGAKGKRARLLGLGHRAKNMGIGVRAHGQENIFKGRGAKAQGHMDKALGKVHIGKSTGATAHKQ